MKNKLFIQIPEPCHEDWNKMTPVEQGRYCQSCCKEVVDFSVMTDQEIISFLSKPRGKTCGNFASDQLNRIITEPATPAKKKFWAMMLSFLLPLFVTTKVKSQRTVGKMKVVLDTAKNAGAAKPVREETNISVAPVKQVTALKGDTIVHPIGKTYEIKGRVTDEQGYPLMGATISEKGTNRKVVTDTAGSFTIVTNSAKPVIVISYVGFREIEFKANALKTELIQLSMEQSLVGEIVLVGDDESNWSDNKVTVIKHISISGKIIDSSGNSIPSASVEIIGTTYGTAANVSGDFSLSFPKDKKIKLRVSAVGFETKEITLTSKEAKLKRYIILASEVKALDEVIITSNGRSRRGEYIGGGISIIRKEDIISTVIDTVANLVSPSNIKLYPNPASRISFVNVKLSQKGNFQLSLLDNHGRLIQQNKFATSTKNMVYQLELPYNIAAGIYHITVIEDETHKHYTQKLIVTN
jgi:hypothetical protein